ncbi:MAG: methyltransferase [Bryobacteraceae bacterium]|jgi:SAM-dependent methyltransferase
MERPTLDKFPKSVLAQIDIQTAFIVSRLIVAAERLQVFRALRGKRMRADAIGKSLKIHRFYLRPFLNSLVSLGLLRKTDDTYWNTPFADKYFVEERSIHWTRQFSAECLRDYAALAVLEKALASGRSCQAIQGLKEPSYLGRMKRDRREAEDFTQMLFHLHQGDAEALAACLDLSRHRAVLDVGGGSGVMSIALAKKNPHLRACIFDIAPVCEIAARNARRARLSRRIRTLAGDIRRALPEGYDVVLVCDIGSVPDALLRSAYRCLPAGGLLVLVDRFLSDDGTKPLDRLVEHFVGASFGLATKGEMVQAVRSCGFRAVRARKIGQDLWLITGIQGQP